MLSLSHSNDISPLEDMKSLLFLEMFGTEPLDLSPLLGCTALEDLNICDITLKGDKVYEVVSQMTWLKRLYCTHANLKNAQIIALRELMPDCEIVAFSRATGGTWRYSDNYYDMRDALGIFYMDDYSVHLTERKTPEEVEAIKQFQQEQERIILGIKDEESAPDGT